MFQNPFICFLKVIFKKPKPTVMKQLIFAVLLFSFFQSMAQAPQVGQQLIEKWVINTGVAGRMLLDQMNCDTCKFKKWWNEDTVKNTKRQLRESLGISRINFRRNWMEARYGSEDVSRYARNHGLDENSKEAQVSGYTTRILRYKLPKKDRLKYANLTPQLNSFLLPLPNGYLICVPLLFILPNRQKPDVNAVEVKYLYFDFGRICPPPHPC